MSNTGSKYCSYRGFQIEIHFDRIAYSRDYDCKVNGIVYHCHAMVIISAKGMISKLIEREWNDETGVVCVSYSTNFTGKVGKKDYPAVRFAYEYKDNSPEVRSRTYIKITKTIEEKIKESIDGIIPSSIKFIMKEE